MLPQCHFVFTFSFLPSAVISFLFLCAADGKENERYAQRQSGVSLCMHLNAGPFLFSSVFVWVQHSCIRTEKRPPPLFFFPLFMIDPQAGPYFLLFCGSTGLINHERKKKIMWWRTPFLLYLLLGRPHQSTLDFQSLPGPA